MAWSHVGSIPSEAPELTRQNLYDNACSYIHDHFQVKFSVRIALIFDFPSVVDLPEDICVHVAPAQATLVVVV